MHLLEMFSYYVDKKCTVNQVTLLLKIINIWAPHMISVLVFAYLGIFNVTYSIMTCFLTYIHMSDAPQMSSQHILVPALKA